MTETNFDIGRNVLERANSTRQTAADGSISYGNVSDRVITQTRFGRVSQNPKAILTRRELELVKLVEAALGRPHSNAVLTIDGSAHRSPERARSLLEGDYGLTLDEAICALNHRLLDQGAAI